MRLDPKVPYEVVHHPRTVALTDTLATRVEVTFPEGRKAGGPTVVLVPGAGPMGLDHVLEGPLGATPLFALVSERLTAAGFTVVRYDKRHVENGRVDRPKYTADEDLPTFAEDLEAVLDSVALDHRVDDERLFLLGFDEGAHVAAAVAAERPTAGLVLWGATASTWEERYERWWREQTLGYLERFAYRGRLDGMLLARALQAAASEPVVSTARVLAVSYTREGRVVQLSPLVDRDRDGILSLDDDVEPAIPGLVTFAFGPIGPFRHLTAERSLPPIQTQLPKIDSPVLLLQGEEDAHTTPADAVALEEAAIAAGRQPDVLLVPEVGHTLGPAADPVDDLHRAPTDEALTALVDWLVEHTPR